VGDWYLTGSGRVFEVPSNTQPRDTRRVSSMPSGEKATDQTEPEWPLSVCSRAPIAVSQSCTLTILLCYKGLFTNQAQG
jgi:hypothetical protein